LNQNPRKTFRGGAGYARYARKQYQNPPLRDGFLPPAGPDSFRFRKDLHGFATNSKDLQGFAKIYMDLQFKDLPGFAKICKDLQGSARIATDLQGFPRNCYDF